MNRSTQPLIEFTADQVELTAETGFIGFEMSNEEHYFWMQPGETKEGINPDKSNIWLERDDQQFGGTGKKWSIVLDRKSFVLHTESLKRMACKKLLIHFDISSKEYAKLKKLLQSNMQDCLADLKITS